MYTEYYGLTGEPFLLTPDHRFFFESAAHTQAMAHLSYGLSRGEGFIVITGEVGAGKTTLVKRLLSQIDSEKIIAAHVVTTMLTGIDLLRMTCDAFGIKDVPAEKAPILLRLKSFFETAHREGRRALLIVDEAQNLPPAALEELRMLSNFQVGNKAPFQSFLIAQPQFRDVMAHPALEQFRQRVIASYHLGPMSAEECSEYLTHRLKHVGWKNDPSFTPPAVEAVFRHTGGIPRRINTLCSRLLLLGFLDNLHRFVANDVDKVAADLAAESSPRDIAQVSAPAFNGTGLETFNGHVANGHAMTAEARVQALEERFNRHETAIKQIVSGLMHLVGMNPPGQR